MDAATKARKDLLNKVLFHLESALYLMDICPEKADDDDQIYQLVSDVQSITEDRLNHILVANMQSKFESNIG